MTLNREKMQHVSELTDVLGGPTLVTKMFLKTDRQGGRLNL